MRSLARKVATLGNATSTILLTVNVIAALWTTLTTVPNNFSPNQAAIDAPPPVTNDAAKATPLAASFTPLTAMRP